MHTDEEKESLGISNDGELVKISDESTSLVTNLEPKIQRFVHLYMTGQYTINKTAQLLEVHPNTIFSWLRREDVKSVINTMQEETHGVVHNQINSLTLKAINKLSSLIDSPIDGVAYQAVKDVLDRGGHKPKNEIKVDKTVTFEEKLNRVIDEAIDAEFEVIDNDED